MEGEEVEVFRILVTSSREGIGWIDYTVSSGKDNLELTVVIAIMGTLGVWYDDEYGQKVSASQS